MTHGLQDDDEEEYQTVTTLDEILERMDLALQSDFECGVAWLADKKAEEFAKEFPELSLFFGWLADLEEVTNDDAHEFYESRGDEAPESI